MCSSQAKVWISAKKNEEGKYDFYKVLEEVQDSNYLGNFFEIRYILLPFLVVHSFAIQNMLVVFFDSSFSRFALFCLVEIK